jgi:hypothetical protein
MKYLLIAIVALLALVAGYAVYMVRGETLAGHARAIEDDPERRSAVFDRLRPSARKIFGTLVQIDLASRP